MIYWVIIVGLVLLIGATHWIGWEMTKRHDVEMRNLMLIDAVLKSWEYKAARVNSKEESDGVK